jgi:hypothetical protein
MASPSQFKKKKTWQDKLLLAFEQKPEKLSRFYIPVYVAADFLDKDALHEKILTEVEQLRKKSEEAYQFAVEGIGRSYEELFCTEDAEILPMGVTHG